MTTVVARNESISNHISVQVAKESAGKFNPSVKIEAHHANIKDPQFNVDWFHGFDLVFNALDNLEARRHVNKMCLAADVPLIESGTTGFNGQVQVIKKGLTECYDCLPKTSTKSFPVCTIRSTPSQAIHCIVWAKSYLFAEIFGTSEDDAPELDTTQDSDNAKEIETLKAEAQALKRIRESMGSEDFPRRVFEKVFDQDIERLRSMEDMWRARKKPQAMKYGVLAKGLKPARGAEISAQDQIVWTLQENFAVFSDSLQRLSERLDQLRASSEAGNAAPVLTFDKDDKDSLDFVTASANLRSIIFGIDTKSEFEIKQMAGNIIPAIATCNAMTAGLCVLQAFKIMKQDYSKARMVFLSQSAERRITAEQLRPPRPDCPVCGVAQSRIEVDLTRATLNDLVEGVLRLQLGYGEDLSVSSDAGILFDPELEENLQKKLSDLDVKSDSFLTIIDEDENEPRVDLILSVTDKPLPSDSQAVSLTQKFEIARKLKIEPVHESANGKKQDHGSTNGHGDASNKRKREYEHADAEADIIKKRGKVLEETPSQALAGNNTVIVEDSGNGAIIIDD